MGRDFDKLGARLDCLSGGGKMNFATVGKNRG